ncbi:YcaO-like family protein [Natronomonas sp. F2-12]|uniref:YcaO-like family protein n=1 Tax=Natronomonas aquatica TaxID=2841590 RepID=A0A9R1D6V0_9EURY|nr:YcaO-like family protein [Natronomonas aquatica]
MTTVGLAGGSAAVEAIRAALEDTDATPARVDTDAVGRSDVAVLAATVGSAAFGHAAERARESGTPLVSVELGGVGGRPVDGVDAAVSGYAPGTACYDCLCERIEASDPDTDGGDYATPTARFAGAVAGRELADLLAGGESAILGGVIELPYTRRRLLPVPFCACGEPSGVDRELRRNEEPRPLEESISLAEVAFDERVGPIGSVGELESFPVPYYLATLADAPFSEADVPDHAAGVGLDWDPAFMKALGEALERYSAAVYRTGGLSTDPAAPIDPARFVGPDDEDGQVSYWHDAEHLETGETVQVPAELVVFPPPERTIRPAITTGLGLGNGDAEAIRSGLYEVLERDAAMLSWYSTYEPIELAVDDEDFETLTNRAASEGLSTTVLLLTQDVDVPVVAACVHRDGGWPRFAAGSAARLDPNAAARGALEEAIQNFLELRRMGKERADEAGGAIGTHAAFPESTRAFVETETTVPAATVGPADPPREGAELTALLDRVTAAGLDAYAARVTPRDVETTGFEAVRVLVPEAQPLFTGESYFGDRAQTVPGSLGFEPRLNRSYHPFP